MAELSKINIVKKGVPQEVTVKDATARATIDAAKDLVLDLNLLDVTETETSVTITTKEMTGATEEADGKAGHVPAPEAGDQDKLLKGDGTWTAPPTPGDGILIDDDCVISVDQSRFYDRPTTDKLIHDGSNSWKRWSEKRGSYSPDDDDVYVGRSNYSTTTEYAGNRVSYNVPVITGNIVNTGTQSYIKANAIFARAFPLLFRELDSGWKFDVTDPFCRPYVTYDQYSGNIYAFTTVRLSTNYYAFFCANGVVDPSVMPTNYIFKGPIATDEYGVKYIDLSTTELGTRLYPDYAYTVSSSSVDTTMHAVSNYTIITETMLVSGKRMPSYQFGQGNVATDATTAISTETTPSIALNLGEGNQVNGFGANIGSYNQSSDGSISIGTGNKGAHKYSLLLGNDNTSTAGTDGISVAIGSGNSTGNGTILIGENNAVSGSYPYGMLVGTGNSLYSARASVETYYPRSSTIKPSSTSSTVQSMHVDYLASANGYTLNGNKLVSRRVSSSSAFSQSGDYTITSNGWSKASETSYVIGMCIYMLEVSSGSTRYVVKATYNGNVYYGYLGSCNSSGNNRYHSGNVYITNTSSYIPVDSITIEFLAVYTNATVCTSVTGMSSANSAVYSDTANGTLYYKNKYSNTAYQMVLTYNMSIPADKPFSIVGGYNSKSYVHNSFVYGLNCIGGDPNTSSINTYSGNDGFVFAFGRNSKAVRNYDIAIGLNSTAEGGENFALNQSTINGYNNIAADASYIRGGVSICAIGKSYFNAQKTLTPGTMSSYSPSFNMLYHSSFRSENYTMRTENSENILKFTALYLYAASDSHQAYASSSEFFHFPIGISTTSSSESKIVHSRMFEFHSYNDGLSGTTGLFNFIDSNMSYTDIFDIGGSSASSYIQSSFITASDLKHLQLLALRNLNIYRSSIAYDCWFYPLGSVTSNPIITDSHITHNSKLYFGKSGGVVDATVMMSANVFLGKYGDVINGVTLGSGSGNAIKSIIYGGVHLNPTTCLTFSEDRDSARNGRQTSTSDGFSITGFSTINCNQSVVLFDNCAENTDKVFITGRGNGVRGVGDAFIFGETNNVYGNGAPSTENMIVFGTTNTISGSMHNAIVFGTSLNASNIYNSIITGASNILSNMYDSFVSGNNNNTYTGKSLYSSIVMGTYNNVGHSGHIINGNRNNVYDNVNNVILTGSSNTVTSTLAYGTAGFLVVGDDNVVTKGSNMGVIGNGITASGHNSIAMGLQLKSNQFQMVVGKYNAPIDGTNRYNTNERTDSGRAAVDVTSGALFIVGNGYAEYDKPSGSSFVKNYWMDEDYIHRSNAMVVYANGNVKAGDFVIDNEDGTEFKLSDLRSSPTSVCASKSISSNCQNDGTAGAKTVFETYPSNQGDSTITSDGHIVPSTVTADLMIHYKVAVSLPNYATDTRLLTAVIYAYKTSESDGRLYCMKSQVIDMSRPSFTIETVDMVIGGVGETGLKFGIKFVEPSASAVSFTEVDGVRFNAVGTVIYKG